MTFKQTWWDTNLGERMAQFETWIGGKNALTKTVVRAHVKENGYKSLVDLGCGPATEFFAYKDEGYPINYLGVDSSSILYKHNQDRGVPMLLAPAEDTKLEDSSYEVAFSRHVLEHQPAFKPVLSEMIRLASQEAIHIFFIPPGGNKEHIGYAEKENLYHNRYNKEDIETYLNSNPKVEDFEWQTVASESILYIRIKNG